MSLGKLVMNLIRSTPGNVVDAVEQVGEPGGPAVGLAELVAVDGLAEEGDLLDPLVGEAAGPRPRSTPGRPALLGPADRGDDAVGAELVAAHHDPDERLERAGPHGRLADRVVPLEARGDRVA